MIPLNDRPVINKNTGKKFVAIAMRYDPSDNNDYIICIAADGKIHYYDAGSIQFIWNKGFEPQIFKEQDPQAGQVIEDPRNPK